jgi:hypothetical protein
MLTLRRTEYVYAVSLSLSGGLGSNVSVLSTVNNTAKHAGTRARIAVSSLIPFYYINQWSAVALLLLRVITHSNNPDGAHVSTDCKYRQLCPLITIYWPTVSILQLLLVCAKHANSNSNALKLYFMSNETHNAFDNRCILCRSQLLKTANPESENAYLIVWIAFSFRVASLPDLLTIGLCS